MRNKPLRGSVLLCLAFSFCWGSSNAIAASNDSEVIEEIIVTGSYIRRSNFDIPSPIQIMDETDLELAGTADLGDIIFDQTFQYGVNANATPFEGLGADDQQWNQGQEVWANLRGLRSRATMTMMDGHRLPADTNTWGRRAGVDINGTYPGIALGRVETILDGASALYGSEAVGGVINLIPKKDFEGLEVTYEYQQAFDKGAPTKTVSLLAGVQGERGGAIFALELRDQDRMRFTDRPKYIMSAADPWLGSFGAPDQAVWSAFWHDRAQTSSPSDYNVPVRDVSGNLVPWLAPADPAIWNTPWLSFDNPVGHAAGQVMANVRTDPGCGFGFGAGHDDFGPPPPPGASQEPGGGITSYNDLTKQGNFLNGFLMPHSNIWRGPDCDMSVSDIQDMQAEAEQNKGMAYFEYEFNDYVKVHGEIVFSANDYNTRDTQGQFDEIDNTTFLGAKAPIVIGDNPGNPFRAFADGSTNLGFTGAINGLLDWDDQNGDGLYQYGVEPGEYYLFAQDANGDGIADRDFNGDGIADSNAQLDPRATAVLLSMSADADADGIPDRFDQDMLGSGGVRLFEDVRVRDGQLLVHPKNPRNNTLEWAYNDGGLLTWDNRSRRDNLRLRLGAEISIPDTDWIVDADWVWAQGKRVTNYPEPLLTEYVNALRCQGGLDGNSCWNPFSTTYLNSTPDGQLIGDESIKFPDADDPGWRPPDAVEVNTELENRQAGVIMAFNEQDLEMQIVDLIASAGSLFELPYNDMPVGFAIGGHWRLETEEWNPNVQNQAAIGGGKLGLRESEQETVAVFAEVQVPLLEHQTLGSAELQLAVRYAEIETRGVVGQRGKAKFDTVIPKVALRYAPTEWVSLRTSLTEGFVTPGLFSLFGEPGRFSGTETVSDYICDFLPELQDCDAASKGGGVPGVRVAATPNSTLGAEESDLWNAGFTLRLLEGNLVVDVDYTHVEFNGRVEQIGAGVNVRTNGIGFEDHLEAQCPGTVADWDNALKPGADPALVALTNQEYRDLVGPAELDCRLNAALNWVSDTERGIGLSVLERGLSPNGLTLSEVENPWVKQGEATTETVIYALNYRFDGDQIPWIGGDYGSFSLNLSATQMLESSLQRFTSIGCDTPGDDGLCPGDNPLAGIRVDGVGNRNATSFAGPGESLYAPLAPTPEWRINVGLRWLYGNHTAQLSGRWHDSITNLNVAWDEQRARGLLSDSKAAIPERQRCSLQPSQVCNTDAEAYWDVSYTYDWPDFMGLGSLNLNVAVRNVFDNLPKPQTMPAGYEAYLDNIMGRFLYTRLSVNL